MRRSCTHAALPCMRAALGDTLHDPGLGDVDDDGVGASGGRVVGPVTLVLEGIDHGGQCADGEQAGGHCRVITPGSPQELTFRANFEMA